MEMSQNARQMKVKKREIDFFLDEFRKRTKTSQENFWPKSAYLTSCFSFVEEKYV